MMSGAIKVSRRMRLRYESLTFSALASSAEEEYSPLSSICRQRWARTTALTRAQSTRGAGDHGAVCQSAPKFDPVSASNFAPFERRVLTVALASSELAGVAETGRARV